MAEQERRDDGTAYDIEETNPLAIDDLVQVGLEVGRPAVQTPLRYRGNAVRLLFSVNALLIGFLIPFSGSIEVGLFFGGSIVAVLVILAAFTNPHSTLLLILDTLVAGLGAFAAEILAIAAYIAGNLIAFGVLQIIAALFVAAFYYCGRSVHAALLGELWRT